VSGAVRFNIVILWRMTPCNLVGSYQSFRDTPRRGRSRVPPRGWYETSRIHAVISRKKTTRSFCFVTIDVSVFGLLRYAYNAEDQKDKTTLPVILCGYVMLCRTEDKENILHTIKRGKANWIGYILLINCLKD
jgi:hypothetical protein